MLLPQSLRISSQLKTLQRTVCVALSSSVLCSGNSSLPPLLALSSQFMGLAGSSSLCCILEMLPSHYAEAIIWLISFGSPLSQITLLLTLMPDAWNYCFLYFSDFFRQEGKSGPCYPNIALSGSFPLAFVIPFWSLIQFLYIIHLFLVHWADFLIPVSCSVNFWDSVIVYSTLKD